jgi:hypothetical protein
MRHLWETPGIYNGKPRNSAWFWLKSLQKETMDSAYSNILASHIPNALTEKLNYRYSALYVGIKQTVLICQFKFSFLDLWKSFDCPYLKHVFVLHIYLLEASINII